MFNQNFYANTKYCFFFFFFSINFKYVKLEKLIDGSPQKVLTKIHKKSNLGTE